MAVVVKKFEKQFNLVSFCKNKTKDLFNFLLPKFFIKWLMKKDHTHLGFEITNACNANCSFCAYRFMKRKLEIINTDKIKKIVKEYSENGGGSVSFTPVVGDPLVDKDLLNKIRICKNFKNIDEIFLYTNGLFLNRFNNNDLVNSGLIELQFQHILGMQRDIKNTTVQLNMINLLITLKKFL